MLTLAILLNGCSNQSPDPQTIDNLSKKWPLWVNEKQNEKHTIWPIIRRNFHLNHNVTNNLAVKHEIKRFSHDPILLRKFLMNGEFFLGYVLQETQKRHFPAEVALLPYIESQYNPFAISHAGANGLWQMMPGTASGHGITIDWWYDGRRNVEESTQAALDYLEFLQQSFNQTWPLALAAYDSGQGRIKKAIKYNSKKHLSTEYWSLHLPRETKDYLPRLFALAAIINDPAKYGVTLPPIPAQPYFSSIPITYSVDIATLAKVAKIDEAELRQLNAGHRRFATNPRDNHHLHVPANLTNTYRTILSKHKRELQAKFQNTTVKKNDNLSSIAERYATTADKIIDINGLKNSRIHPGQKLLIPITNTPHQKPILSMIAGDSQPGPKLTEHIVKAHESIGTVAKQHGVKNSAIIYWNQLGPKQKLKIGQKIVIWKNNGRWSPHKYKVKYGDTLSEIALRFHSKVNTITKTNHMKSTMIHPGQILYLPRSH